MKIKYFTLVFVRASSDEVAEALFCTDKMNKKGEGKTERETTS